MSLGFRKNLGQRTQRVFDFYVRIRQKPHFRGSVPGLSLWPTFLYCIKNGWWKMFAVVKTGGKQYKVAQGDVIQIEKLPGEAGAKVELDQVLLVCEGGKTTVGAPTVKGAKVKAEILEQGRTRKIIVFKKKRRQNYRRKNHHRQEFSLIRITEIAA